MGARVSETARLRPGRCAITNDTEGPFIDTGTDIARYGRVYLSIRGLRDTLRGEGFMLPEDTEALREDHDRLQEEVRRLTEVEEDHIELVNAVRPYLDPEVEVRTEVKVQVREPNDEEIEAWIEKKGGNHRAVRNARGPERGSTEEWRELYGDVPPGHPQFSKAPTASKTATLQQETASQDRTALNITTEANIITIHEQEVNLNEVLAQNVGDVMAWAEGHTDDVHDALIDAEYQQARAQNRSPRKGVVEGLGYEYVSLEEYFAMPVSRGSKADDTSMNETEARPDVPPVEDAYDGGSNDESEQVTDREVTDENAEDTISDENEVVFSTESEDGEEE